MISVRQFFLNCYELRRTLLIPGSEPNKYPFGEYHFNITITYGLGALKPLLYENIRFAEINMRKGATSVNEPILVNVDDSFLNIWLKTDESLDNIMFTLEEGDSFRDYYSPPDYCIALKSIVSLKYNINPITLFGEEEPKPLP